MSDNETLYQALLKAYVRISRSWYAALRVGRVNTAVASRITAVALLASMEWPQTWSTRLTTR